jgi:penicillin-binding protein 1A
MRKSETGGRSAGVVFAHFYRNYLELHPEIPRTFVMPEKVNKTTINGAEEYFTEISKLPKAKMIKDAQPGIEF